MISNSMQQFTASISSSSSSTVDTVTELNLPMFFVCFVTITYSMQAQLCDCFNNQHCWQNQILNNLNLKYNSQYQSCFATLTS